MRNWVGGFYWDSLLKEQVDFISKKSCIDFEHRSHRDVVNDNEIRLQ